MRAVRRGFVSVSCFKIRQDWTWVVVGPPKPKQSKTCLATLTFFHAIFNLKHPDVQRTCCPRSQVIELTKSGHAPLDRRINVAQMLKDRCGAASEQTKLASGKDQRNRGAALNAKLTRCTMTSDRSNTTPLEDSPIMKPRSWIPEIRGTGRGEQWPRALITRKQECGQFCSANFCLVTVHAVAMPGMNICTKCKCQRSYAMRKPKRRNYVGLNLRELRFNRNQNWLCASRERAIRVPNPFRLLRWLSISIIGCAGAGLTEHWANCCIGANPACLNSRFPSA